MTDLMERLHAADPVPHEPEAPDVHVLLGTRLEATPRRRRARVVVPALAALAVIAAVVFGSRLGGSSPDALAAARKALGGEGEIVHMVVREEAIDAAGNPL